MKFAIFLTASMFGLSLAAIAGEEKQIAFEDLPESIIKSATDLLPNATFTSANTEQEDGETTYELQGKLNDGRNVEVDVLANGKIEEFEVEFSQDLVPGAVLKAIERKMPGFTPTYIEASHSASKKVVKYEFVGKLGDQDMDINVSADGRRIEVADN